MKTLPTNYVEFDNFPCKIEVYTDDDYREQAADLGLCPKFSRTQAQMRMSSMELNWDVLKGRRPSFKKILSQHTTTFPKRISWGCMMIEYIPLNLSEVPLEILEKHLEDMQIETGKNISEFDDYTREVYAEIYRRQ